jgi:hypothetical protein
MAIPTAVGRNALVAGPLILMGLIVALWYGTARMSASLTGKGDRWTQLEARRDQILNRLATLDNQFENQVLTPGEYQRQRELEKRRLRRISLLLGGKK